MPQTKAPKPKKSSPDHQGPKNGDIKSFLSEETAGMASENSDANVDNTKSSHANSNVVTCDLLAEFLTKTEDRICKRLGSIIDSLKKDLNEVKQRVSAAEAAIEDMETRVVDAESKTADEVKSVQDAILMDRVYQRKYNLLLYGIQQSERENIDGKVRDFFKARLGMEPARADEILFANVHRLPRREKLAGLPEPVIVKFLSFPAREEVYHLARSNGENLRKLKMSVRTDLPPELKIIRGKLAKKAYDIRKEKSFHTRIIERGISVYLEYRENREKPWKRVGIDDNI